MDYPRILYPLAQILGYDLNDDELEDYPDFPPDQTSKQFQPEISHHDQSDDFILSNQPQSPSLNHQTSINSNGPTYNQTSGNHHFQSQLCLADQPDNFNNLSLNPISSTSHSFSRHGLAEDLIYNHPPNNSQNMVHQSNQIPPSVTFEPVISLSDNSHKTWKSTPIFSNGFFPDDPGHSTAICTLICQPYPEQSALKGSRTEFSEENHTVSFLPEKMKTISPRNFHANQPTISVIPSDSSRRDPSAGSLYHSAESIHPSSINSSSINSQSESINSQSESINHPSINSQSESINPSSINPQSESINPPSESINHPSESINPSSINPPSESINPSSINPPSEFINPSSINPPSEFINHPSINFQSESINHPYINPQSESVNHPSINFQSESINHPPTNFQSESINPPSESINHSTGSIKSSAESINQPSIDSQSESINPQSESTNPPSESINSQSESINHPSINHPSINHHSISLSTGSIKSSAESINSQSESINHPSINHSTGLIKSSDEYTNPPFESIDSSTKYINYPVPSIESIDHSTESNRDVDLRSDHFRFVQGEENRSTNFHQNELEIFHLNHREAPSENIIANVLMSNIGEPGNESKSIHEEAFHEGVCSSLLINSLSRSRFNNSIKLANTPTISQSGGNDGTPYYSERLTPTDKFVGQQSQIGNCTSPFLSVTSTGNQAQWKSRTLNSNFGQSVTENNKYPIINELRNPENQIYPATDRDLTHLLYYPGFPEISGHQPPPLDGKIQDIVVPSARSGNRIVQEIDNRSTNESTFSSAYQDGFSKPRVDEANGSINKKIRQLSPIKNDSTELESLSFREDEDPPDNSSVRHSIRKLLAEVIDSNRPSKPTHFPNNMVKKNDSKSMETKIRPATKSSLNRSDKKLKSILKTPTPAGRLIPIDDQRRRDLKRTDESEFSSGRRIRPKGADVHSNIPRKLPVRGHLRRSATNHRSTGLSNENENLPKAKQSLLNRLSKRSNRINYQSQLKSGKRSHSEIIERQNRPSNIPIRSKSDIISVERPSSQKWDHFRESIKKPATRLKYLNSPIENYPQQRDTNSYSSDRRRHRFLSNQSCSPVLPSPGRWLIPEGSSASEELPRAQAPSFPALVEISDTFRADAGHLSGGARGSSSLSDSSRGITGSPRRATDLRSNKIRYADLQATAVVPIDKPNVLDQKGISTDSSSNGRTKVKELIESIKSGRENRTRRATNHQEGTEEPMRNRIESSISDLRKAEVIETELDKLSI